MVPPTKKYESNSRESNASQVPWRSTHKSESIDSSAPWPVPASARQVVLSTKKYESDDFQESNDSQVPRSSVRQECGSAAHLHLRSGGPVRPPTLMFLGSILIATAVVWKSGVVQRVKTLCLQKRNLVSAPPSQRSQPGRGSAGQGQSPTMLCHIIWCHEASAEWMPSPCLWPGIAKNWPCVTCSTCVACQRALCRCAGE